MFRRLLWILGLCLFLLPMNVALAQITPTVVETPAADGLVLKGDFYLVDAGRPTIVLLHQLYTNRTSWTPYIGALTGAGFNVLAVDLRGHGQTRGRINWATAITDIGVWFNWLRAQGIRGDALITMGSSIGSSLAIVGCANDAGCRTAVALSPGWASNGVRVEDALKTGLVGRKIFIMHTVRDRFPALGVPQMVQAAPDVVVIQTYPGNAHGMDMLRREETAMQRILEWLAAYSG